MFTINPDSAFLQNANDSPFLFLGLHRASFRPKENIEVGWRGRTGFEEAPEMERVYTGASLKGVRPGHPAGNVAIVGRLFVG